MPKIYITLIDLDKQIQTALFIIHYDGEIKD